MRIMRCDIALECFARSRTFCPFLHRRELELEKQYCAQAAALCEEEAAALRGARLKLASLKSKLSASRLRAKRDAENLKRES